VATALEKMLAEAGVTIRDQLEKVEIGLLNNNVICKMFIMQATNSLVRHQGKT